MSSSPKGYKEIAKASGLVAFVQIFQMLFSLLRNKMVSLFVGASGFGVWSLLQTFSEMLTTFSTLGVDQGGVREIAKYSGDKQFVGKIIFVFRFTISFVSLLFGIFVFLFSTTISQRLFNTTNYASSLKVIAIAILFYGVAKGGFAILNGVRALRKLAVSQILGAVFGSVGAIVVVYLLREDGISIAIALSFVVMAIVTTLFIRKLHISAVRPTIVEFKHIFRRLLYLGLGFTVAGCVSTAMTLLSKSFLSTNYSLDAVGIYQASWMISNLYVGIILNAMGIDLMPRLAKVSSDSRKMNEIMNQQIVFSVVFAPVGMALILFFAPEILTLLYSSEFSAGVTIIRWQIIGVFMRLIAFPFGYAIMTKGMSIQYAVCQTVFWSLDYLLLMLASRLWGFNGLGVNYFCAYSIYLFLTYCMCRYNHGFKFEGETKKAIFSAATVVVVFWILGSVLSGWIRYVVCSLVWILQVWLTYGFVKKNMEIDVLQMLLKRLRK